MVQPPLKKHYLGWQPILKQTKAIVKEIYEGMYCKPGSDKAVPKRERMKELSDIMEEKVFLVIVEGHNEDPIL